jgi:hypothetical protein
MRTLKVEVQPRTLRVCEAFQRLPADFVFGKTEDLPTIKSIRSGPAEKRQERGLKAKDQK